MRSIEAWRFIAGFQSVPDNYRNLSAKYQLLLMCDREANLGR
jgi:hypothetical protein